MRFSSLALVLLLVLVVLILSPLLPAAGSDAPLLHLQRGTFDARQGTSPPRMVGFAEPASERYAIIQLNGPILPGDREALRNTGVRLLEYIPDYAYLVRGTPPQLAVAAQLPEVYARIPFTLADKLAPGLLRAVNQGMSEVGSVNIIGWSGDMRQVTRDLNQLPFDIHAALTPDQLLQVAALDSVRWIETASRPRLLNDAARTIMGVDEAWQARSLYGQGQIIGISDSGLDTGEQSTMSPDFAGRVVATQVLAPGGDWADQHGHGTHVAGSAAGAGVQSGADPSQSDYLGSFAGVAPEAQLAIQAFEIDADGYILGMPADYYTLFDQMYDTGARLHSNSWGDITDGDETNPEYGGYVQGTRRTDAFVWDHPDMTIFAAAGNSGADGVPANLCIGDGVIDPDSILSPGTAKNVITVGASESTNNSGPYKDYYWLLLGCFFSAPIGNDLIADSNDGMAAFSSRGPTDDGRYKPDIVAPGINIVSNHSQVPGASELWGAHDAYYSYSGGTSMATPLTAGMGAIVRQWLQQQGAVNPSAALVKATLLNTTYDMAPGQYGTGATQEIPFTRPNSVNGWGRADVRFIDPQPYYGLWFDDHSNGLATLQTVSYTHSLTRPLQVLTDTIPLRIMLTWTDPPASPSAAKQLVNDLDLTVTDPEGVVYYGNGVTGDRLNNVEGVIINSPVLGAYEINIQATNVPSYTQPYALVVAGPMEEVATISGLAVTNDSPTALGNSTSFTATVSAGTDVTYAWDFGDGDHGSGPSVSHAYVSAGHFTAVVTASNSLGQVSASTPVTITVPPPTPPGSFDKSVPTDGATDRSTSPTLSWETSSDASFYEYCYDTTNDDACSSWTSSGGTTSVTLTGLSTGTTYYWHVRAVSGGGTTYSNGNSGAYWSFTTQPLISHFTSCVSNTGDSATVLIPDTVTTIDQHVLEVGDEIAIYDPAGTICAGVGSWDGNNLSITVWGDNPLTTPVDGMLAGQEMTFHTWDASALVEHSNLNVTYAQGNGIYSSNSFHVVGPANPPVTQAITAAAGWNMISSYINPEDPDLWAVMGPVSSDMVLLKNGVGEVFWPDYGINQIGDWNSQDGYQLYMTASRTLTITGTKLAADNTPMSLDAGWNMVAYLPDVPIAADQALSSISGELVLAKDNYGQVYWPDYGIDQIGDMLPGQGYQLYLAASGTLTYPAGPAPSRALRANTARSSPEYFSGCVTNTGNNATVLIPYTVTMLGDYDLQAGDEIAVYNPAGTICAGVGTWDGNNLSITVWGDDSQTEEVDGMLAGDTMHFRVWDHAADREYEATATYDPTAPFHDTGEYAANRLFGIESLQVKVTICYTLTLSHTGTGSQPTASPTSSSDCATGEYVAGEAITVTAYPATGHHVESWSGTDDDASADPTNTISMPESNHAVVAQYARDEYFVHLPMVRTDRPSR